MQAYIIEAPPVHANAVNYFSAALGFYRLGYFVERFKLSEFKRKVSEKVISGKITNETPVFGGMESLQAVLPSYVGLPHYPEELKKYLYRQIRICDISDVQIGEFFKPRETQQKLFLPRVKDHSFQCELTLGKIPAGTQVLAAQAVKFVAEYRVYVLQGEVINICFYKGNPLAQANVEAIAHMVSATKHYAAAYGLDVGILETGETALVELSDFCCLGNYGLKAIEYAKCIAERWHEVWQQS